MEFISETHKATINEGLLVVRQVTPREVRVTKSAPGGGIDVEIATAQTTEDPTTKSLLEGLARMPTFAAGYAGDQEWNVDLEAGFGRWRGVKPSKDLSFALTKCGFDAATKKKIMSECRKHPVDYVPRYG